MGNSLRVGLGLSLGLLATGALGAAPPPRLVTDLGGPVQFSIGTQLVDSTPTGEGLVFFVWRFDSGHEVWGARGEAPAERLLDLCPLADFGAFRTPGSPLLLTRDGQVFFSAACGAASSLWVTDGTAAGTRIVAPGFDVTEVRAGVGVVPGPGRAVIFGSFEGRQGLWAFGPVGEAPIYLADLSQLAPDLVIRSGSLAAATSRGLVFGARDLAGRADVWITDGTAGGTRRLAELGAESFRQSPFGFVALGPRVLFLSGTHAADIWSTDGTPQGTVKLVAGEVDPRTGARILVGTSRAFLGLPSSGSPAPTCWSTDGTLAGTKRAEACATLVWGDRAVFGRDDRLWTSDGTTAVPLPGLPPGTWTPWLVSPELGLVAERQRSPAPAELWLIPTPGSAGRPIFVANSEFLTVFGATGGGVYFADLLPAFPDDELRLWRTDGTTLGTVALGQESNLLPGVSRFSAEAWWVSVVRGDRLQLLRLTDERSVAVDLPFRDVASNPARLQTSGESLFLTTSHRSLGDPTLYQLTADGIEERLTTVRGPAFAYRPLDDRVLYWTEQGPYDLWLLDEAGSHSLYRTRGQSHEFTLLAPALTASPAGALFADSDGLYRVDSAAARVDTVKALPLGSGNVAPYFARRGDELFFFHRLGNRLNEGELWRTDGTAEGTAKRADVAGLFLAAGPARLLWFGDDGRIWTVPANGGTPVRLEAGPVPRRLARALPLASRFCLPFDRGLWASDGTEAGTLEVKARTPPWRSEARTTFLLGAVFENRCFFVSDDPDTGHELWSSDGTVAGTRIVADLFPGPASSFPDGLTVIGDRLLFRASDGVHGTELWSTDGTAAGTLRLTDLAPGRASADPSDFTVWGQELAFVATDAGEIGREVWALPLSSLADGEAAQAPAPPGGWLTSPEVPGFRFKVRIARTTEGRLEPTCLLETACVSGALPGRPEVFLRVVGPKPNGLLWPTLVKFSTSEVEVWIEQIGLGTLRYYRLEGARPGFDELPALFDRAGFLPAGPSAAAFDDETLAATRGTEPPPDSRWVTTPALPGFRFAVTIGGQLTRKESACLAETLCVSGAIPGRAEVFVRVVGPKPNGFLWPTLARFSTSEVEVWIEQIATATRKRYRLEAAGPGRDVLTGSFDREGFEP